MMIAYIRDSQTMLFGYGQKLDVGANSKNNHAPRKPSHFCFHIATTTPDKTNTISNP